MRRPAAHRRPPPQAPPGPARLRRPAAPGLGRTRARRLWTVSRRPEPGARCPPAPPSPQVGARSTAGASKDTRSRAKRVVAGVLNLGSKVFKNATLRSECSWELGTAVFCLFCFFPAAGLCLPAPKVSLYSEAGDFLPVFWFVSKLWALDPFKDLMCGPELKSLQNLKQCHVWGRQKRLIFLGPVYIYLILYPLRVWTLWLKRTFCGRTWPFSSSSWKN